MARKVTFAQQAGLVDQKLREADELANESASEYDGNQSEIGTSSCTPMKRLKTPSAFTTAHLHTSKEPCGQSSKSNVDTVDNILLSNMPSATITPDSKFDRSKSTQQPQSTMTACDTSQLIVLLTSESMAGDSSSRGTPEAGPAAVEEVTQYHVEQPHPQAEGTHCNGEVSHHTNHVTHSHAEGTQYNGEVTHHANHVTHNQDGGALDQDEGTGPQHKSIVLHRDERRGSEHEVIMLHQDKGTGPQHEVMLHTDAERVEVLCDFEDLLTDGAPCVSQAASNNGAPCSSSLPPPGQAVRRANPVGCRFMLMDDSSDDEDDDALMDEDVSQCVISVATGHPIPGNLACRPKDIRVQEQDGDEAPEGEYTCERIVDEALHPGIYSGKRQRNGINKNQKPQMWFLLKWKDYELNPNYKDYGGHWEPEESLLTSTYTIHMLQKWKRSKPTWYKGKPIRYPPPPKVKVEGDEGASWQLKKHKWTV